MKLKFLSKVYIEFNALDPRIKSCIDIWRQCHTKNAFESNPNCELILKRRTDDHPPQITVTFTDGEVKVFDASKSVRYIGGSVKKKHSWLRRAASFQENGAPWPVMIPEEELKMKLPGLKQLNVPSTQW